MQVGVWYSIAQQLAINQTLLPSLQSLLRAFSAPLLHLHTCLHELAECECEFGTALTGTAAGPQLDAAAQQACRACWAPSMRSGCCCECS